MIVHFEQQLVQRLLAHSKSATRRSPTMEQMFEGRYRHDGMDVPTSEPGFIWPDAEDVDATKIPVGLWLIGDTGVYFMSNGLPGLMVAEKSTRHLCALAFETDPSRHPETWYDAKRIAFGGDDGVQFVDTAFIETMIATAVNGIVALDLTPQCLSVAYPSATVTNLRTH